MKITVELSLYPMSADPIPKVVEFIGDLVDDDLLEVSVNQMSTQLRGELEDVMEVLTVAMQRAFAAGHKQALIAKFLNVDLPITEAPDLAAYR